MIITRVCDTSSGLLLPSTDARTAVCNRPAALKIVRDCCPQRKGRIGGEARRALLGTCHWTMPTHALKHGFWEGVRLWALYLYSYE